MPKLVTRRITPAGFLLALLLFLFLPGLAASCDAQPGNGNPASLEYTGTDLATGGHRVVGDLGVDPANMAKVEAGFRLSGPVQVLAIVTAALLLLGLAPALLRTPRARALAAVVVAGAAAAMLAVTESQALAKLTEVTRKIATTFTEITEQPQDPEKLTTEAVHVQYGFWLTAGVVLAVFVLNVFVALRRRQVTSDEE